jgi:hypothetical protein
MGADWQAGITAIPLARAQYVIKSQDVSRADLLSEVLAAHTVQAIAVESK